MKKFIAAKKVGNNSPQYHILFNNASRTSVSQQELEIRNDPQFTAHCLQHSLKRYSAFAEPEGGRGFGIAANPIVPWRLLTCCKSPESLSLELRPDSMQPRTRQNVVRILLGRLLDSDLSVSELRNVADVLTTEALMRDLSLALSETLSFIDEPNFSKQVNRRDIDEDTAYMLIQRRRLSKNEVLELIASVSPNRTNKEPAYKNGKLPIRTIVRDFFRSASVDTVRMFMDRLQNQDSADPYLKGIIRRG